MGAAYGVGLILIYLLVVAQFKSYLTPLVIMAPIPLTIIGVMPGHALLGRLHRHQHDRHDRAGRHHRAQLHPAGGLHRPAGARRAWPSRTPWCSAAVRAQPIVLTGAGRHDRRGLHPRRPHLQRPGDLAAVRHRVSTLLTLVVIPVLYYAVNRRRLEAPVPNPDPGVTSP
jgi:hypothetical protein